MIHHIIITTINAATIRPIAQRLADIFFAGICSQHPTEVGSAFVVFTQINFAGRPGAGCFNLSIKAAVGGASRLILFHKVAQAAK